MSNNKHLRINLGQSDNIILENRDAKESIVDFVCILNEKTAIF